MVCMFPVPNSCGPYKIKNVRDLTAGYDNSRPDNKPIQAEVRWKAVADVFKSAHSIVQKTILSSVDEEAPNPQLPKISYLTTGDTCLYIYNVCNRSWQTSADVMTEGKSLEGFRPSFGRIQYFVRHRFLGVETNLAHVKWLPRAECDDDTNLFVIDMELPTPPYQPFLPLEVLSHPW
uniref:Uncharacterized protein n=1 Tax=Branchiostoma floridae TaxID=7739 RepID=C3YHF5_BRAFL|eukprot:XP_002604380.1 hypothetical protein BRAFLDRAFT_73366 [Branchiostoma floridae]